MANIESAKKQNRQNKRHAAVNGRRVSKMRTHIRNVEDAIASGDKTQAETALRAAQPEIMRSCQKGDIHRNQAARKISRMAARIKAMAA